MPKHPLSFHLNGQAQALEIPRDQPALATLREQLGVLSLRPGCSPQGVCGSCAVLVNGKFRLSCTLPARSLEGKQVQTLEGWPQADQAARAFAAHGAALGGYELPGLMMQAQTLQTKRATDSAGADKGLLMHLVRGGGWGPIKAAIASIEQAPAQVSPRHLDRALGLEPFVEDLSRPGMLHAALAWMPAARARLQQITAPALPAGAHLLLAQDLAMSLTPSEMDPVLPVGSVSRHAGQVLAVVLAKTQAQARSLRDALELTVERMEPLTSLEGSRVVVASAMDSSGAHPDGPSVDLQLSLEAQPAACIEPPAYLAVPLQGQSVRLYSNAECAGAEATLADHMVGLPQGSTQVELMGSRPAPGGRDELTLGPLVVAAALKVGRPVKLTLELGEAARVLGTRHAARLALHLQGGEQDLGLRLEVDADSGGDGALGEGFAYPALAQSKGAYQVAGWEAEVRCFQTNNPPAGGVDGDGEMQVLVALELAIDQLADARQESSMALRGRLLDPQSQAAELLAALPQGEGWSQAVIALRQLGLSPASVKVVRDAQGVHLHLDRAAVGLAWEEELRAMTAQILGVEDERISVQVHSQAPPSPSKDPALTLLALQRALQALPTGFGDALGEAAPPDQAFSGQRAAAAVHLNAQGQIDHVVVQTQSGAPLLPVLSKARVQAAVQEGLGAALTERITSPGGLAEDRLRTYGLIKSKYLPRLELLLHQSGPVVDPSPAARIAVAAAAACAVARFEGQPRGSYPARDSEAAYGLGIKRPRR